MDESQDIRAMDPQAMRITFNLMSWMLPLAGGDSYRQAPPILRDTLIFPYFQGMLFAIDAAREDGWEGIHRIYSEPPVSTEQILHPAKYLDAELRDMPQRVMLPELKTGTLPTHWKHLGGNVLGELQTSIMLKKVLGGRQAAEGWDGDRYEVYQSETGELAMTYVSIWDSQEDAEQFEAAYRTYRQPKAAVRKDRASAGKGASPDNQSDKDQSDKDQSDKDQADNDQEFAEEPQPEEVAEQDPRPVAVAVPTADMESSSTASRLIQRHDNIVYVVEAFGSSINTAVMAQLIEDTHFEEKRFPTE